jgi:hypothetical protein
MSSFSRYSIPLRCMLNYVKKKGSQPPGSCRRKSPGGGSDLPGEMPAQPWELGLRFMPAGEYYHLRPQIKLREELIKASQRYLPLVVDQKTSSAKRAIGAMVLPAFEL